MQFNLEDDYRDVAELAEQIFTDRADLDRINAVERTHGGFDRDLWSVLATSGLLAISLPEKHQGSGLGMLGLVALLEQQGRRLAPVPLWSVVTTGAMPIAQFGDADLQQAWLPGVLDGSLIVTGAFETDHLGEPIVHGTPDGDGWILSGSLDAVAGAPAADALVVPFSTNEGVVVAVIACDRPGVEIRPASVTNRESSAHVVLNQVPVAPGDLLRGDGVSIVRWVRTRARIALAALCTGLCQEAIAITAAYTSDRVQFDRPLSTNQAVTQRAADAHIDAERIRLTTYKAAWHADRGQDEAAYTAAIVAKWWADTGGFRVVSSTQHLHGGIGADVDYPIHRYYLWGRQIFFTLGSRGALTTELGDLLDRLEPIGAPA